MNLTTIAILIFLALLILGVMWMLFVHERDPHGIDAYSAEVTSSNPAAIFAQMTGLPLNEQAYQHCEELASLYPRVRSALMRQIVASAGSLDREELVQAAIRTGYSLEIAEAYADEIIDLTGEPLPAAMLHRPNIGDDDAPVPYQGPNYSPDFEIAREMKTLRHYGTESGE